MKEYTCDCCGKYYNRYATQRRGKHNFCSTECRFKFMNDEKKKTHIELKCDNCGEMIYRYRRNLDQHAHHFCNSECQYAYQSGKNHPFYGKSRSKKSINKISTTKKKNYKKENHPMFGKYHSEEAKEKMRKAHLNPSEETRALISKNHAHIHGEAHPNWKGGISLLEFEEAYGIEMKEWCQLTMEVRKRDNFTCQYCGISPAIIVHHIIPRHIEKDNSMNNLITLCSKCHGLIEAKTNKFIEKGIDPISIFYEIWQK